MKKPFKKKISVMAILFISFTILIPLLPLTSATNGNPTQLSYRTSLNFENSTLDVKIKPTIDLTINHSGFEFPGIGNGTIQYYFSQNITEPAILNSLKMFFTPEIIQYLQNHTSNQYFTTYFSGRTESTNQNLGINDSDFLTYFWIAADKQSLSNIQKNSYIYFFNKSDPSGLGCDGKFKVGTNSMDESQLNMVFSPTTMVAYKLYLKLSIGDSFFNIINYYDSSYGVLLNSNVKFNTEDQLGNLQGDFSFQLVTSNLAFEKSFNYIFLILMISFAAIVIIIFTITMKVIKLRKLSKKNQKKNRLENL